MSTATIPTRNFVGLLADATLTASDDPELPALCAVLLHSDRGEWTVQETDPDDRSTALIDVITSDLLIATSTDRYALGQAHEHCEGQLHKPVVVSLTDAKAVIAAFKPLVHSLGKETTHHVVLTLEGDTLTVAEDPKQVPDGFSVSFSVAYAYEEFPRFADLMTPDTAKTVTDDDGRAVAPSYGTGFEPTRLWAFVQVGKRRKMLVAMYRHHQTRAVVIEVGSAYRGVLMPYRLDEKTGQQNGPLVRVFTPDLPERPTQDADALLADTADQG
ncbi:MAG TPA: hypothetical protein VGJ13_05095 [Pseudonocardiaceae bacterium]|jgi:hypothetical protein